MGWIACLTHRSSGIDLASSKELIAHERDRFDIAKHIGADEVIFQDLQDLIDACAELSPKGEEATKFEVGVFSGKYITEVPPGYFEHLDEVRGKKRKIAVVEEIQVPAEGVSGKSAKIQEPPAAASDGSARVQHSSTTAQAPIASAPTEWADIR